MEALAHVFAGTVEAVRNSRRPHAETLSLPGDDNNAPCGANGKYNKCPSSGDYQGARSAI